MNRFHNKYHRHNHHTLPTAGEPDSSHDPIASPEDPFKGDFVVSGVVSASSGFVTTGTITAASIINTSGAVGAIYEKLLISPTLSTTGFYFKVDSCFYAHPLVEVYRCGVPKFVVTSNPGNVGINTATPDNYVALDVNGHTRVKDLTADNIVVNNNATIGGLDIDLGYFNIGYTPGGKAWVRDISGNENFHLGTNTTSAVDNLILYPDNTNKFTGKLGISANPIETFTLSGNMSFREKGVVVLDNVYDNVYRIRTNATAIVESDRNQWVLDEQGRVIHGNISLSAEYADDYNTRITTHKHNIVDNVDTGDLLSLNNSSETAGAGTKINMFRTRGGALGLLDSVNQEDLLGSINAHGSWERGYTRDSAVVVDSTIIPSAKVEFIANNYFTDKSRGAYISVSTIESRDPRVEARERLRINDNGFIGINTSERTLTPATPQHRLHIFEHLNGTNSTTTGTSTTDLPNAYDVIKVESVNTQNSILLCNNLSTGSTQRQGRLYLHNPDKYLVLGNNTSGGSLLFEVNGKFDVGTGGGGWSRRKNIITSAGDVGTGTIAPEARLHVRDDDGSIDRSIAESSRNNIVILETENNENGISLSSYDAGTKSVPVNPISCRIYTEKDTDTFHFATYETEDMMKFSTGSNTLAMTITKLGNVIIGAQGEPNFDEQVDTITSSFYRGNNNSHEPARLAVHGDMVICNRMYSSDTAFQTDLINNGGISGARLYFNTDIQDRNSLDPVYIYRVDKSTNVTELRVNVGNNNCCSSIGSNHVLQTDYFSVGAHDTGSGAWVEWLSVNGCTSKFTNNLNISGNTVIGGSLTSINPYGINRLRGQTIMDETVVTGNFVVMPQVTGPGTAVHPVKMQNDVYIQGNLYVTGNITGFWGQPCTGGGCPVPKTSLGTDSPWLTASATPTIPSFANPNPTIRYRSLHIRGAGQSVSSSCGDFLLAHDATANPYPGTPDVTTLTAWDPANYPASTNYNAGGGAPSDERLKDNVSVLSSALDVVSSMRGVEFDWNENSPIIGHDVGVIAQDIEPLIPSAISEDIRGYKNVDYYKIIPYLIESIKALKKEIQELKQQAAK